tara:strand:+ start:452 stop:850 length:399 start_codon:yes stop_codon:yes gene_type:complete
MGRALTTLFPAPAPRFDFRVQVMPPSPRENRNLRRNIRRKDAQIKKLESSNKWLKAAKYKFEKGFIKYSISVNMPHLSHADIVAMSPEEREAAFYELEWVKKAVVRLEIKRSQNILSLQGHSGYIYALLSDK